MRGLVRLILLFAGSIAAMGLAYGAGFASGARLRPLWDGPSPGGVASGGAASGVTGTISADDPAATDDFGLFWEALSVVRAQEAGAAPEDRDVTYGAIRGSLRALDDPYTLFSDPVDTAVQQPELDSQFEGIGAYVAANEKGQLVIQTPMRGQPAERAGLRSGDIVLKVDGRDISQLDVNEAVLLIRGPKGTTVTLTILRAGHPEPIEISVVRDRIDIPSVNNVKVLADLGAPDVGYLQLTAFAAETKDEIVEALRELEEDGARAFVLDLRDNPGGYLNAAIDVSSQFVADGPIVFQEDKRGRRIAMESTGGGAALEQPLVVLVNRGSASASEIVAGAIRDRERGLLVGETTFGKGSVQNVHKLSDGSQLRVTVAAWLTPNGTRIHKTGIEPDVVVTRPPQPTATPTPGPGTPTAAPPPTATAVPAEDRGASMADDVQLQRALAEARRMLEAR